TTGSCCENRPGFAHTLQHRGGILDSSIDVEMRAQIFRKFFLVASTPDCDCTESHTPRKLDTKVPKAANALHGDQISAAQAGIAKSVVCRDPCTEERGRLCGSQLVRNGSNAARFSNHHLRISSISSYSRHHRMLTIHHVSASARFAYSVFPSDQADTNTLTDFPFGRSAAQGLNAANYFMPRNARQSKTRIGALDSGRVGVANAASFHPNPNLTWTRLSGPALHYS